MAGEANAVVGWARVCLAAGQRWICPALTRAVTVAVFLQGVSDWEGARV